MTPQQQEQLIKELEKRKQTKVEMYGLGCIEFQEFSAALQEIESCINLIKQTTVNRSSTEPKFIEG